MGSNVARTVKYGNKELNSNVYCENIQRKSKKELKLKKLAQSKTV